MNLGIEDAAWLAWLIEQERTEDYTRDRLPVAKKVLRFTKLPTQLIASNGWIAHVVRNRLLPFGMKIPFVRRRAIRTMHALDTPLPHGSKNLRRHLSADGPSHLPGLFRKSRHFGFRRLHVMKYNQRSRSFTRRFS